MKCFSKVSLQKCSFSVEFHEFFLAKFGPFTELSTVAIFECFPGILWDSLALNPFQQ